MMGGKHIFWYMFNIITFELFYQQYVNKTNILNCGETLNLCKLKSWQMNFIKRFRVTMSPKNKQLNIAMHLTIHWWLELIITHVRQWRCTCCEHMIHHKRGFTSYNFVVDQVSHLHVISPSLHITILASKSMNRSPPSLSSKCFSFCPGPKTRWVVMTWGYSNWKGLGICGWQIESNDGITRFGSSCNWKMWVGSWCTPL